MITVCQIPKAMIVVLVLNETLGHSFLFRSIIHSRQLF